MKKLLFAIICILLPFIGIQAQITGVGKFQIYNTFSGIDYLVIFNGIDNNSEISYNGNGNIILWYKYSDRTNPISNLKYITPEDNTGYILDVDGKKYSIWVFDYREHLPEITSVQPATAQENDCENLKISIAIAHTNMVYESLTGRKYTVDRFFNLEYQTLEWSEGDKKWIDKKVIVETQLPVSALNIDAPLRDTHFIVSGDQFAADLGLEPVSYTSTLYQAKAVRCKITTTTSERTEKNEAERPDKTSLSGSSPLDVAFESNGNVPITTFYRWEIKKNGQTIISRNDQNHRYVFVESGTYNVVLRVSNSNQCAYSDSVTINISTSALQVPNVFTPNGDGLNDEFRVGYKSLKSFECWVYNSWGRKVYYWNDPQKGWDGKISGRDAAPGPYFYVIRAYGTDFDPKSERDKVTKRRVGEYLLKGDINLLRGASE
jgi:gliding motility-associated-like protein